jgi:hypothetical protein
MPSNIPQFQDQIFEHAPQILSGIAGAVVNVIKNPNKSWFRNCANAFTGIVCTVIFTPALNQFFHFPQATESAVAFVVGLTAMNICDWLLEKKTLDILRLLLKVK